MALANSVEVRYPFLDLDLIELSKTIPPDLKLRNFQEKYILRKIAEPALPSMITRREKFGWFAPGSPEMLQQKVEWINDVLDEESIRRDGYFDADAVSALRKRYSEPGFKLNYPFENDWLIVIATFGVFKRIFDMPDL
jgi:asparagine synthase (glutamine-hydrolysing)